MPAAMPLKPPLTLDADIATLSGMPCPNGRWLKPRSRWSVPNRWTGEGTALLSVELTVDATEAAESMKPRL